MTHDTVECIFYFIFGLPWLVVSSMVVTLFVTFIYFFFPSFLSPFFNKRKYTKFCCW